MDPAEVEAVSQKLKFGTVHLRQKNYDRAIEIFKDVCVQYPNDFRAFYNISVVYTEINQLELAVDNLLVTLRLNPNITETYGCLSTLYIKLRNPDEAARVCLAGLEKAPRDRNCLFNLNTALRQLGQIEEAIASSWKAVGVNDGDTVDIYYSNRNSNM